MEENGGGGPDRTSAGLPQHYLGARLGAPEPAYFFDALQAVPVPVVPFIELPFTVPV